MNNTVVEYCNFSKNNYLSKSLGFGFLHNEYDYNINFKFLNITNNFFGGLSYTSDYRGMFYFRYS